MDVNTSLWTRRVVERGIIAFFTRSKVNVFAVLTRYTVGRGESETNRYYGMTQRPKYSKTGINSIRQERVSKSKGDQPCKVYRTFEVKLRRYYVSV